jgi:hypothetical protein
MSFHLRLSLILEFWENWYVLGENDQDQPEFKFIYYNGKTRQNTYEGAFVYSRGRELEPASMQKVYDIAKAAGMNPDQFCKIRNGCFDKDMPVFREPGMSGEETDYGPFRGILASTKVSELLGVEQVSADENVLRGTPISKSLQPVAAADTVSRPWWYDVGDYFENPHRHFEAMDNLRVPMEWPEDVTSR